MMNQKDALAVIGIQLERIADLMAADMKLNRGLPLTVKSIDRKAKETTHEYLVSEYD